MTNQAILSVIKAKPFKEFIVRTTDHCQYRVYRREGVAVHPNGSIIVLWGTTEDDFTIISSDQITALDTSKEAIEAHNGKMREWKESLLKTVVAAKKSTGT